MIKKLVGSMKVEVYDVVTLPEGRLIRTEPRSTTYESSYYQEAGSPARVESLHSAASVESNSPLLPFPYEEASKKV
jgi:hypothetical protein